MTKLSLTDVAKLVSGKLVSGKENTCIDGVHTLAKAVATQATFLSNMKYKSDLLTTQAGLLLLTPDMGIPEREGMAVIHLDDPYIGFAILQRHFHPSPVSSGKHHITAAIDTSAQVAECVQIDANVTIAEDVKIGSGSIVGAGCVLDKGVVVGKDCLLHPRVVLEKGTRLGDRVIIQSGAVLGSDGFGFAWTGKEFLKIPQVGRVVVEDDVEIGANTCVDRGAIEDTVIKTGAKLDNLIQVAHSVEIGELTVMAGQSGVAGSTIIGKGCQVGAQSGVAGHLKLVDGAIVGAKAGVIGDIKEPGMVSGFPAVPHRKWLRSAGMFDRLPEIWKKIKKLN